MHEPTDHELWQRSQAGDHAAFGDLYERHASAVHAFCLRRTADEHLADDLTSTVFLEAWRQRGRREVTTPSARAFLFGVATNVLHQHWRTLRRHAGALARMRAAMTTAAPSQHEAETITRLDAVQRVRAVRDALQTLPRRELDVLTLVAWGELSYEETAAALDVPVGTVRSRLSRARARLGTPPPGPLSDLITTQGPVA